MEGRGDGPESRGPHSTALPPPRCAALHNAAAHTVPLSALTAPAELSLSLPPHQLSPGSTAQPPYGHPIATLWPPHGQGAPGAHTAIALLAAQPPDCTAGSGAPTPALAKASVSQPRALGWVQHRREKPTSAPGNPSGPAAAGRRAGMAPRHHQPKRSTSRTHLYRCSTLAFDGS